MMNEQIAALATLAVQWAGRDMIPGNGLPMHGFAEAAVGTLLRSCGIPAPAYATANDHRAAVEAAGLLRHAMPPPAGAVAFFAPPNASQSGMVAVIGDDGRAWGAWQWVWEGRTLAGLAIAGWYVPLMQGDARC